MLPTADQKVLPVSGPVGAHAVAILHQDGPAKAQPGCLALGLVIWDTLRIGAAPVRVVAARLPTAVDPRIARVLLLGRWHLGRVGTVLAHETLQAGPRFDEGAVCGGMFIAGPAALARELIDFGETELGDVGRKHAVVVLGQDAVIEAALAELAVQKAEPEQVVAQLLAEEPLTAHAVEGGQHMGLEPLFRREAGSAVGLVEVIEPGRTFLEDGTDLALAGAPGMVGGDWGIEVEDGEEIELSLGCAAHTFLQTTLSASCLHSCKTFSTAC